MDTPYGLVNNTTNSDPKFICRVCKGHVSNSVLPCGNPDCIKCALQIPERNIGCPCCRETAYNVFPFRLGASGESPTPATRLDKCQICLDDTASADIRCGHVECTGCSNVLLQNGIPKIFCSHSMSFLLRAHSVCNNCPFVIYNFTHGL